MPPMSKRKRVAVTVLQYLLESSVHRASLDNAINRLLCKERFLDVTLACDGLKFQCHRIVLAAASPLFEELLVENPAQHPIVILPASVRATTLKTLIDFIYRGRTNVGQYILSDVVEAAELLQIVGITEGQPQFTLQEIEIEQEVDNYDEEDGEEEEEECEDEGEAQELEEEVVEEEQVVQPQEVIDGVLSYRIEHNNDPELQRQIQESHQHQQELQQQIAQQRAAYQMADRQQAAILKAAEKLNRGIPFPAGQAPAEGVEQAREILKFSTRTAKRQPVRRVQISRQPAPLRLLAPRSLATQQQGTQTMPTRKRTLQLKPLVLEVEKQLFSRQQKKEEQPAPIIESVPATVTPARMKRSTSKDIIVDYIDLDDNEDPPAETMPPEAECAVENGPILSTEPLVQATEMRTVALETVASTTTAKPSSQPQLLTVISTVSDQRPSESVAMQTIAINRPHTQPRMVAAIPGIRMPQGIQFINLLQLTGPRAPGAGPAAGGQISKFAPLTYIQFPVSKTPLQAPSSTVQAQPTTVQAQTQPTTSTTPSQPTVAVQRPTSPIQTQPITVLAQTRPSTSTTPSQPAAAPPQRPCASTTPMPPMSPSTPGASVHQLRGPPKLIYAPNVNPEEVEKDVFLKPYPVFKPPPPPTPMPDYMRENSITISPSELDLSATREKIQVENMAAVETEADAAAGVSEITTAVPSAATNETAESQDVKPDNEDIEFGETMISEADFPMFYAMMKKDLQERKARDKETARVMAEIEADLARQAAARAEADALTEEQKVVLREKMFREKAEMAARYREEEDRLIREEHARFMAEGMAKAEAERLERIERERAEAAAAVDAAAEEGVRARIEELEKVHAAAEQKLRADAQNKTRQVKPRAQAQSRSRAQAKARAQAAAGSEAVMDTEAENIICQPNLSFICDCNEECEDNGVGICIDYDRLMAESYSSPGDNLTPAKPKKQSRKKPTRGKRAKSRVAQPMMFSSPDFLRGPNGRNPDQPHTSNSVNATTSGPEDSYFHDKLLFTDEETKKLPLNSDITLETISESPPPLLISTRETDSQSPENVILRNPRSNQPRTYSTESLYRALMDVKHGESIYRSAQHHRIPRKTLRNWMKRWGIKSKFPMPRQLKKAAQKKKNSTPKREDANGAVLPIASLRHIPAGRTCTVTSATATLSTAHPPCVPQFETDSILLLHPKQEIIDPEMERME